MQGTRGQIRTRRRQRRRRVAAAARRRRSRSRSIPASSRSKPDGTAEVAFDIPAFAGTVRVMAVAWTQGQGRPRRGRRRRARSGGAHRDAAALPAQRRPRHACISISTTSKAPAGDYRVALRQRRLVTAVGNGAADAARLRPSSAAPDGAAAGIRRSATRTSTVQVSGPRRLRARAQLCARREARDADPGAPHGAGRSPSGESLTLSNDLFADLVPGTGSVALSVGPSTALDAAALLKALDRYPFGCSEQITSRAMPLLYVNELASAGASRARRRRSTSASATPSTACWRGKASNGSFGLWSVGGDDAWLDAYVTDFLTRARERGFAVPEHGVQARARPAAQLRRDRAERAGQGRRPRSRLCALCAGAQRRGAARRPALSRRHQARRLRDADRQGADRRGARACSATARAPSASTLRRSRTSPPTSRSSNSAAPITARRCAMPRRW